MADHELTTLLNAAVSGNREAERTVLSFVYDELHKQASIVGGDSAMGQPTLLVHEVWIRLFRGRNSTPSFASRRAFFGYATKALRNLLVDHLRADKRSATNCLDHVLDEIEAKVRAPFLDLEEALTNLQARNPRRYEIVSLRFFASWSMQEIADELGVSLGTVEREWRLARVLLKARLSEPDESR